MCRLIRGRSLSVLSLLLVVLVTPSLLAQSWISAVTATPTTTTATINWTTAVPANAQVAYGTTPSYGSSSLLNPNFTTTHSSNLTSLTAGTSYHYRVQSADATGVLVGSLDYYFTTLTAPVNVTVSPTAATVVSAGTQQFSAQVTNTSNTAVIWSAAAGTVSTTGLFTAPAVTVNQPVTVTATSVADPTKYASATVTVTASAMGTLTLNPGSLSFGSVTIGQTSAILTTTLTNTGSAALTITNDSISAGDFNWGGRGTCNYGKLAAGSSCLYSAKFTPTAAGSRNGTITIYSNGSNPTLSLPLSGIGATGTLTVSPTPMVLGSVVVGATATASGVLTASGANVTVSGVSSDNSAFSIGGLPLPITIPAGQSAAFTVTFSPQTSDALSAALTFNSNALPSTTIETLTGTGTAAPVHAVNLSWNASTSSDVSGYNIYRAVYGTSCGAYSKINSVLNTTTLYTDFSVVNGTNYCYATTAMNSSNEESGYSNVVSNVQIPAPTN